MRMCCHGYSESHWTILQRKEVSSSSHMWNIQVSAKCGATHSCIKLSVVTPLHPWKWPERVWQQIQIDFAEKDKHYFLVTKVGSSPDVIHHITTYHWHFLEAYFLHMDWQKNSFQTMDLNWCQKNLVSSWELNGIRLTAVPAHHRASNGAAKKSVKILKWSLMKNVLEADAKATLALSHRLGNYLIMYRSTPHTVTGRPPAVIPEMPRPSCIKRACAQKMHKLAYVLLQM